MLRLVPKARTGRVEPGARQTSSITPVPMEPWPSA